MARRTAGCAALLALLAGLSASCGGGGSESSAAAAAVEPAAAGAGVGVAGCPEPAAASGFDAQRGFVFDATFQKAAFTERLAHLRCLTGAPAVARNALLDAAADRHAAYALAGGTTAHDEAPSAPLYSGVTPGDRMRAAGYRPVTWGEVVSRTGPLADEAYDGLVAAVYHRLAMIAPQFDEVGVGLRADGAGTMVMVADYGAQSPVPSAGRLLPYPADGQRNVPRSFDSDLETPDPAPDAGVVGYPVSLQTDRGARLRVDAFELVRATDGAAVPAMVRGTGPGASADAELDPSEAFMLPRAALEPDTDYEARFAGSVDGQPVARRWRFRTQPVQPLAVQSDAALAVGQYARVALAGCSGRYTWSRSSNLEVSVITVHWMQVRALGAGSGAVIVQDGCGRSQRLDFSVR